MGKNCVFKGCKRDFELFYLKYPLCEYHWDKIAVLSPEDALRKVKAAGERQNKLVGVRG